MFHVDFMGWKSAIGSPSVEIFPDFSQEFYIEDMGKKWKLENVRDYSLLEVEKRGGEFVLHYGWERNPEEVHEKKFDPSTFFDFKGSWYWFRMEHWQDMVRVSEIMMEIAQEMNGEGLSEEAEKCLKVWKSISETKFEPFTQTIGSVEIRITRSGIIYDHGPVRYLDGKHYFQYETFPQLLFLGPIITIPGMADRKLLLNRLLNCVNPMAGLDWGDGFPLFHYSRIPKRRWEYDVRKSGFAGEFVEIESDHISIGGWSSPSQGGSRSHTFERFYTDETLSGKIPENIRGGVNQILEAARSHLPKREDSE